MRICIEVSGGMVQNVYAIDEYAVAEPDVDVTICDFDIAEDASDSELDELYQTFDAFRANPKCFKVW